MWQQKIFKFQIWNISKDLENEIGKWFGLENVDGNLKFKMGHVRDLQWRRELLGLIENCKWERKPNW